MEKLRSIHSLTLNDRVQNQTECGARTAVTEYYEPSSAKLYEKLEAIDFDPLKKAAIYKFANDLSHMTGKGFDPALVAETQKNTAYLLEMIATLAPKHHAGLVKLSA